MRTRMAQCGVIALAAGLLFAVQAPVSEERERRLPSGKSQTEEMLKSEHEKSLQDADRIMKVAEELKVELERNEQHVVSLGSIKKTEEIEKLAKRIRGRLRRY